MELGELAEAESMLRDALDTAQQMGLESDTAVALSNLGLTVSWRGRNEEGARLQHRAIEILGARGDLRNEGSAWLDLALIEADRGDTTRALDASRRAEDLLLGAGPGLVPYARAARAVVHLARDEPREAREAAELAHLALDGDIPVEAGRALVRVTWARALHACGEHAAAKAALELAMAALDERAAKIRDETLCRQFLEEVPENRLTRVLARAWS